MDRKPNAPASPVLVSAPVDGLGVPLNLEARAAQLLEQNNHSIAAVAEEVGILDVNYFTKIFKKTLGVTPTRYRREHKEK